MNLQRLFSALLLAGTVLAPGVALAQTPPSAPFGDPWFNSVSTRAFIDAADPRYAGGMKCDGSTDDAAAFAAAITAGQSTAPEGAAKRLFLPIGRCLIDPTVIAGQIIIQGAGDGTVLVLRDGSADCAIDIVPGGPAFAAGAPYGEIQLRDLRIEAQTVKTGSPNAHGVCLRTAGNWRPHVTLANVTIYGMPGDGIHGEAGGHGWIDCVRCTIHNNLANGVNANSVNDWHFDHGTIGVNGTGVQLSGAFEFDFDGTNIFSNVVEGVHLFSAAGNGNGNHQFRGVSFDDNGQCGVTYDMRGLTGAMFSHDRFRLSSQSSVGTYADFCVTSTANNEASISQSFFGNAHASDATWPELQAISFAGTTNTVTIDGNNHFAGGTLTSNRLNSVLWAAPATGLVNSPNGMNMTTTTQNAGFILSNATNVVASLTGFDTLNDGGIFKLLKSGTVVKQDSAASSAASYNTLGQSLGSTTTPPALGDLVAGHRQYNGTTITALGSGGSDCGTSPAIIGNDNAGRITVGSGANGGKCTFTFKATWTNAPICTVANETSGARAVFPVPSATQLVVTAASTLTAADVLTYSCQGYQ